jgi:hypothetical protein
MYSILEGAVIPLVDDQVVLVREVSESPGSSMQTSTRLHAARLSPALCRKHG